MSAAGTPLGEESSGDLSPGTGSSNINEVIRAVLNFFFFFTKRFCEHKKHKNANKRISDFFPLRCFYAHKNTDFFVFVCLYAILCLIKM